MLPHGKNTKVVSHRPYTQIHRGREMHHYASPATAVTETGTGHITETKRRDKSMAGPGVRRSFLEEPMSH